MTNWTGTVIAESYWHADKHRKCVSSWKTQTPSGTLIRKTLHLWVFVEKEKIEGKFNGHDFIRILMMYLGYLTAKIADVISFEKKPFSPPLLSLTSLSSRTVFNSTSTSWKMRSERYHQRQLADCSLSLTLPFSSPFRLLHVCQVARTSSRTCSNSLWYPLSRLSSFPKLCVNYQAMGELEDGWEAGINSAL